MATAKKSATKNPSGLPLLNYKKIGGNIKTTPITAETVSVDPLAPTDTTFDYKDVVAGLVSADQLPNQFMTAADYKFVDPTDISNKYGDLAREQAKKNIGLSSEIALSQLDTELKGLQSFAPAAAALQRGEIAKDNLANQAARDAQLAAADPNLRADLMSQRDRANAFASGRLPSSIDDRAYELGIRSRAADAASGGGFGVRSSAARKASELMSAESRVGLSKMGDDLLTGNLKSRADLLLAPTEYATAGSDIKAMPQVSASKLMADAQSQLNDKTIISSEAALTNTTNQEQFKSDLEQQTRTTNVNLAAQKDATQASLNLQASSTNAQLGQQAQEANQRASITTQQTAIQTKSQEKQFGAQLKFNVESSNADRAFSAANANAGRQLQVAESNRTAKLQIQQTNGQMIFQDIQSRRAEAGANARAAMSAAASQSAIAANLQAQQSAQAFSLQQQQAALAMQQKGIEAGQHAADVATVGTIIGKTPEIISGVGSISSALGSAWNWISGLSLGGDEGVPAGGTY